MGIPTVVFPFRRFGTPSFFNVVSYWIHELQSLFCNHPLSTSILSSIESPVRRLRLGGMRRKRHFEWLLISILGLGGYNNVVNAQGNATCIPLSGSKTCSNFTSASVSTSLTSDFPFLQYVSNVEDFDTQFTNFIATSYAMYLFHGCVQDANV